jgi:uncharacterized membrane protein
MFVGMSRSWCIVMFVSMSKRYMLISQLITGRDVSIFHLTILHQITFRSAAHASCHALAS